MPKFNVDQLKALNTRVDENVLVSAGAGSGKTNTLTEKVSRLLKETDLKTNELLVLTFTNNAAYEMKTRIIEKCQDDIELRDKILSSHIQTFDSFSQYLVNKYSYHLGISDNISISNDDVMTTKILTTIDEILDEYYSSEAKYKEILITLRKLSLDNDKPLKDIVISLYNFLSSYLDEDKDSFVDLILNKSFTREHFDHVLSNIVNHYKNIIKEQLLLSYFLEKNINVIKAKEFDIEELKNVFSSLATSNLFELDYHLYKYENETIQKLADFYKYLLDLEPIDFLKEVHLFMKKEKEKFSASQNQKAIYSPLDKLLGTASPLLSPLLDIGTLLEKEDGSYSFDLDNDYFKICSFKDDIKLIVDIYLELDRRLFEYQKSTNSYTFKTLNKLSIRLLDIEEVKEEIKETFKYIMVDEYQDTNDIQEKFLNTLLEPRKKDGGHAALFVVGDAKQAIYAFRNSNVELFKRRMNDKTNPITVIPMNKNYRSGALLLKEINHLFSFYMTLSHGDIAYKDDNEALEYDNEVNLYKEEYDHFGIKRIISFSGKDYDGLKKNKDRAKWEALAIINDIKNKLASGYLVSERDKNKGNVIRKCRPSDFAIIVRKKDGYDLYKELFTKYDLKLNIEFDTNLVEADAIIAIQSLISIMSYILNIDVKIGLAHVFMSLARSYIYQYDDQKLFDILSTSKNEQFDINRIKEDAIYQDIESFVNENINKPFGLIFLRMVEHFKILDKLYLIGNVNDNVAKIDSLYHIIMSLENSREGIKEFVELMKNISKFDLGLDTSSKLAVDDAVDIMSIHGSKGLERKIIYLPNSYNFFTKGGNFKTDYAISKENGLMLPYYKYLLKPLANGGYENIPSCSNTLYLIEDSLKTNKSDLDEHVRLFYVALTRAENTVYIVGDPTSRSSDMKKENLYGMLNYLPSYPVFNKKLSSLLDRDGIKENVNRLNNIIIYLKNQDFVLDKSKFNNGDNYQNYINYFKEYFLERIHSEAKDILEDIEYGLFLYYYQEAAKAYFTDLDSLAIIFAHLMFNVKVFDFNDLVIFLEKYNVDVDEDDEEEENDFRFLYDYEDKELLRSYLLNEFSKALFDANIDVLNIYIPKTMMNEINKKKKIFDGPIELKNSLLNVLASIVDNIDYIYYYSYQSEDYQDEVSHFDYHDFEVKNDIHKPTLDEAAIDETVEIEFLERFKEKASKGIEETDEDLSKVLNRGTYLHRLLELVDFVTRDTSFIENEKDCALIDEVLKMPLFDEVNNATHVYKEYGYTDIYRSTTGFIDLFFISNINGVETYTIVDYKTRHTKDDGYVRQLNIYKENIIRLFKLDTSKVNFRLMLLSIEDKKIFEIKN